MAGNLEEEWAADTGNVLVQQYLDSAGAYNMTNSYEDSPKLAAGFRKVLDSHGYSFQYAVLKAAEGFCYSGASPWIFEVAELPVTIPGRATRIDFVLKHPHGHAYLIAECKRTNPRIAKWCFARTPLVMRNFTQTLLVWERVRRFHDELRSEAFGDQYVKDAYRLGLELRGPTKGEATGGGRGAIEQAVTQVLVATNGFVEFLARTPELVSPDTTAVLLPAVFTTAELYVSDVALDTAGLGNGKLPNDPNIRNVPWLIYQYHQSPDIGHSVPGNRVTASLGRILEIDICRSVAIVAPDGIGPFLQWSAQHV